MHIVAREIANTALQLKPEVSLFEDQYELENKEPEIRKDKFQKVVRMEMCLLKLVDSVQEDVKDQKTWGLIAINVKGPRVPMA